MKKHHILLSLICLTYITLKLIMFSNGNTFFDEGVYIGMAKYLFSAGTTGYFESIRPLALPLLLTPLQILPFNDLIVGRILSMLLSIISILLIYWSAKTLFNKKAALWAVLFTTTSISVLLFTGYILNDLIAYTLVLVATTLTIKEKYFTSGLIIGLSFLFKFPTPLVILPLSIYVIIHKRNIKPLYQMALGSLLTASPYFIFNYLFYSGTLKDILFKPLLDASALIEKNTWVWQSSGLAKYLTQLIISEFILISIIALGIKKFYKEHKHIIYLFLANITIFLLYFSFKVPRYDPRYIISILPFLFILGGLSASKIIKNKKHLVIALLLIIATTTVLIDDRNFNHTQTISNEIQSLSGTIITNSAFVMLDSKAPVYMDAGINLGHIFKTYYTNPYANTLILDPKGYPCPDRYCEIDFKNKLSTILHKNNILSCGFLHGAPLIIITKDSSHLAATQCLDNINFTLPSPKATKLLMRLNSVVILPDGTIKHKNNINNLINLLIDNNITPIITLTATNNQLNNQGKLFLNSLPAKVILGFIPTENEISSNKFIEIINNYKKITLLSSRYDTWTNYAYPNQIKSCLLGPWDSSITSIPCKKIDIYTYTNRFLHPKELSKLIEPFYYSDYEIIIDVPAYLLNNENYKSIISFITTVVQR